MAALKYKDKHNKVGKGVEAVAQAVPQPIHTSDQPPAHLSPPSTQQTSDPIALVLEHGQSSDLRTASFSQSHESEAGPFTSMKDSPLEAISIPLHQGPLKLPLQDHKKLFKDVVGNLSVPTAGPFGASTIFPGTSYVLLGTSDVLLGTSDVLLGTYDVPPGTSDVPISALTVPAGSLNVPTDVSSSAAPAGVSSKGNSPMVEEDIHVKVRTFKHMEEDRLGEEAAKRLHDEEIAQLERQEQRMAALIKKKRQALAVKLAQSTEAPIPLVPEVPFLPAVSSPLSSRIRRKSLGQKHILKPKSTLPKLDLAANAQTFIKVLPTPLGEINALYCIDGSTKHFTTLRRILHMVYRQDLVKLYGLVVQYYENHPIAGAGLILWGDLQVLFDSHALGKGFVNLYLEN
uniref:Aminoacyl-tRNA synthetase, class 1a, anticodon-binding n=1 Tax=Tanacetum cinerariifolium TaxID=118510 RepID=A0A6L2J502_TANCI|nr:aminoacyl-tRNA synthetase, class 1a, anticodon-binding [Tanacetum cinerariifolium]